MSLRHATTKRDQVRKYVVDFDTLLASTQKGVMDSGTPYDFSFDRTVMWSTWSKALA